MIMSIFILTINIFEGQYSLQGLHYLVFMVSVVFLCPSVVLFIVFGCIILDFYNFFKFQCEGTGTGKLKLFLTTPLSKYYLKMFSK